MNQKLLRPGRDDLELSDCRTMGSALARSIPFDGRRATAPPQHAGPSYARRILAQDATRENVRLLNENLRLIRTAEKDLGEPSEALQLPLVRDPAGNDSLRVSVIARAYLDHVQNRFDEESCAAFVEGFQEVAILEMSEIWALKPALQRQMLERLAAGSASWPALLTSLRHVGELDWKDLFETVNHIDRVLGLDPAGAYARMDFESRDRYRNVIARLARRSSSTEEQIAAAVMARAREAAAAPDGSRAAVRRTHIGYYLIDAGLRGLQASIEYRPSMRERLERFILRAPTAYYLISIEICTFLVMAAMLEGLDSLTPVFGGLFLLFLPATQAGVSFVNGLVTFIFRPRTLPRLDFSKGIPPDCTTVVAVPSLLINEAQVRNLVLDLEIRFLANRDPQLYFALLTDCPDSDKPIDNSDCLIDLCTELIEGLNRRYSGSPFILLHRHRVYNEAEGRWMGWERKRGKLLDFNRLLRGGYDSFPVKVGNVAALKSFRYVITLDSDTQLPRDSASKLIGTIAHPLNAAVVDPARRIVVEGYGILQPRIGISIESAARSRLAALYSGETGFDIYTRAVSDVYQDLFGEGAFTGKGIYEVDAIRDVLENSFPENVLLSHDLIEGAYARTALVSDIELIDDYPSHFSAYSRRKHRWMRGDWQTLRWLFDQVPDRGLRMAPNQISIISRWKILDNLRRSLQEPSLLVLLLGAWLWIPGRAGHWTLAAAALPFIATNWALLFTLLRAPLRRRDLRGWLHNVAKTLVDANTAAFFTLVFLLHQALISVDAIVRSILRMFVTGRRLLEWETAAEAEAVHRSKATVDVYLEWTPYLAAAIGVLIWFVRRNALPFAAPILFLWGASRALSAWLNRPPRTSNRVLEPGEIEWLRAYAGKMWRFFCDWSSPTTNWLVPDHVREDGTVSMVLSPTNLGMLLNARIAAVHLGTLTLEKFAFETTETLTGLAALPKHRGHLLNWYDIPSLQPTGPRFVSTVDSGNLAASLWTLRQAALAFRAEPAATRGLTPEIGLELASIAATCDRLVREMDFHFLYEPRRKVLSVGYDLEANRIAPSYYDLLASEARMATFIAIAKGDIPQEAWFHLGRAHTLVEGERVLLSWTGTMFEYLMPVLWMHDYPGTILHNSVRGAVKAQREYARRKGVPWGISESAYLRPDGGYGYGPFGIPDLAAKHTDSETLVVSPYSSFLAAPVDPAAVLKNLKQIEEFGWTGRYGFFEAIDYTHSGGEPVRSWMAHHQGMSLLAICNLLFNQPFQHYFHAEPQVLATELLLHERIPAAMQVEKEEPLPKPVLEPV
jgi:cyclic beta-1,2-glucan synthetase